MPVAAVVSQGSMKGAGARGILPGVKTFNINPMRLPGRINSFACVSVRALGADTRHDIGSTIVLQTIMLTTCAVRLTT